MNTTDIWIDDPVTDHGVDVPRWIDEHITCATVAAIVQGGCASGAYMPAVTYHEAQATMNDHGDDVFEYLETHGLGATDVIHERHGSGDSWGRWACTLLSYAVELWAVGARDEIAEALEAQADD